MRRYPTSLPAGHEVRTLLPGDLICDRDVRFLWTILGSCVSVCLWDQRLRFGGMTHHILPSAPANGERSAKYGDVAVPELIRRMIETGSDVRNLRAKVFGGAAVLQIPTTTGDFSIGQRNAEIAFTHLSQHRIPVVACRLGGTEGITILKCTDCGDVWVRSIATRCPQPAPETIEDLPWCSSRFTLEHLPRHHGRPFAVRGVRPGPPAPSSCGTCRGAS